MPLCTNTQGVVNMFIFERKPCFLTFISPVHHEFTCRPIYEHGLELERNTTNPSSIILKSPDYASSLIIINDWMVRKRIKNGTGPLVSGLRVGADRIGYQEYGNRRCGARS